MIQPHESRPLNLEEETLESLQVEEAIDGPSGDKEVLRCRNGTRYEGTLVKGQAHGQGKFLGLDGSSYEGQWAYDKAHGYGKYSQADGGVYLGEWRHDVKSGEGV